jgi:hypothetical protein
MASLAAQALSPSKETAQARARYGKKQKLARKGFRHLAPSIHPTFLPSAPTARLGTSIPTTFPAMEAATRLHIVFFVEFSSGTRDDGK